MVLTLFKRFANDTLGIQRCFQQQVRRQKTILPVFEKIHALHSGLPDVVATDSLEQKKVRIKDVVASRLVTVYVCGPTVYDDAHIGHARTYVQFDAIRRILSNLFGYEVAYFVNVTDIDDKILNRSREQGIDWKAHARNHEREFFDDMSALGVQPPTFAPHATGYIDKIIEHIDRLKKLGLAYCGKETGSVYFDLLQYENIRSDSDDPYGALDPHRRLECGTDYLETAQNTSDFSERVAREKKNPKDFALWKSVVSGDPVYWNSPWGKGRPGWHAECTAMIGCTAGSIRNDGRLDIHGGGIDLKFPHHENERVQGHGSFCCEPTMTTAKWCNLFLHTGHLYIKGMKMSKSLKNFITIKQLLGQDKSFESTLKMTPRQARLMFLSCHYTSRLDFSSELMQDAIRMDKYFTEYFHILKRFDNFELAYKAEERWKQSDVEVLNEIEGFWRNTVEALANDFDTPKALNLCRDFVSKMNSYAQTDGSKFGVLYQAAARVNRVMALLGIGGNDSQIRGFSDDEKDPETDALSAAAVMDALVWFRGEIRKNALDKDLQGIFVSCDKLRDEKLAALGVRLNDLKSGKLGQWTRF